MLNFKGFLKIFFKGSSRFPFKKIFFDHEFLGAKCAIWVTIIFMGVLSPRTLCNLIWLNLMCISSLRLLVGFVSSSFLDIISCTWIGCKFISFGTTFSCCGFLFWNWVVSTCLLVVKFRPLINFSSNIGFTFFYSDIELLFNCTFNKIKFT